MSHDPRRDFADHEMEALAILVEEMGEALADVGKMLRHGKTARDGHGQMAVLFYDNKSAVQKELIDVMAAIMLCEHVGLFRLHDSPLATVLLENKIKKLAQRFHYIGADEWVKAAMEKVA